MNKFWRADLDPENDPHKVLIERDKLIDTARDDRPIKIKVYYPDLTKPNQRGLSEFTSLRQDKMQSCPVIIWSHGLGGGADGAGFLSRFLASHGFIMVHVQHHGTDTTIWEGKEGHPWDVIRKTEITRDMTLNRFNDIPFVLDNLQQWFDEHPRVGELADMSRLAMSGHSFGALTTQVMAGMKFPNADNVLTSYKDDRFQCGILYSPGSVEHLGNPNPQEVYPSIDIPLFHMTGTDDGSPLSGAGYEMRLVVHEHSPDHKDKRLLVLEGGDHMVFNGSRGKLHDNPNREEHEAIIKMTALAYLESTLKKDDDARGWLTGEGCQNWLGDNGEFK